METAGMELKTGSHKKLPRVVMEKIGYVILGSIPGLVALYQNYKKDELVEYQASDDFTRGVVEGKMSNITDVKFNLGEDKNHYPFVPSPRLNDIITTQIGAGKLGGLLVVYGPNGSGKTTYFRDYACNRINEGGKAIVLQGVTSVDSLSANLGIPVEKKERVWDFLPKQALIIIDQAENSKDGESSNALYRELATRSRLDKEKFRAIVILSDIKMAHDVLLLNGRDKIKPLCKAVELQWSDNQIAEFVSKRFETWSTADKQQLIDLASKSRRPGFLVDIYNDYGDLGRLPDGDTKEMKTIQCVAIQDDANWKTFSELDN